MRSFTSKALLLVLSATIMAANPSAAIRGTTKMMTRRSLQLPEEGPSITSPKQKEAKDIQDKGEKEDKGEPKKGAKKKAEKEDKGEPKKGAKKDKKACKKAAEKGKLSKKEARRRLQTTDPVMEEEDVFVGDVASLEYCSHGELSVLQCADLADLPSDGKLVSALKIGLVHNDEKHPQVIIEEAEAILDSGYMESRFVGCVDMDTPPPPPTKKGDNNNKKASTKENGARRRLARRTAAAQTTHRMLPPLDEHEIIFKAAEEEVDVTGVDFRNLKILRGACQDSTLPEGAVCDVIKSDIDIYYKTAAGQDPTDEDREDMHNLLIETIVRQANAGAFGDLGSVESVKIEEGSGFGSGFKNGSSSVPLGPVIGGVLASLLVAGSVFLFCCRGGDDDEDENPKGHNDDTSDEEQYTSSDEEEDKKQRQASVPEAQVVAVEDLTAKTGDAKEKTGDAKEKQGWW